MTYPTALDYFVFISFAYIFSTVVQVFLSIFTFVFLFIFHTFNQLLKKNEFQQFQLEKKTNFKTDHPSVWAGAPLHEAGQWGILSGRT